MGLNWNGAEVKAKVREAAELGIDATLAACVGHAKREHEWMSRTGYLEASITIKDFARSYGPETTGRWGADAGYALFLEVGTSRKSSGAPRAQMRALAAMGNMWEIAPPQPFGVHTNGGYVDGVWAKGKGPLMEPRLYLRPAAEVEYGRLGLRIALAYNGLPS